MTVRPEPPPLLKMDIMVRRWISDLASKVRLDGPGTYHSHAELAILAADSELNAQAALVTQLRADVARLTDENEKLRADNDQSCACRHDGRGNLDSECQEHEAIRVERDALKTEVARLTEENTRLKEAVEDIHTVLGNGPCGVIACPGCAYEFHDAARTAAEVLGEPFKPANYTERGHTDPVVALQELSREHEDVQAERDALRQGIAQLENWLRDEERRYEELFVGLRYKMEQFLPPLEDTLLPPDEATTHD